MLCFAQNCGYNAGTAKFCPKCGNPLNPQPVQETPVQNEPVAQTVQSEPVEQQQFGTQPQSGGSSTSECRCTKISGSTSYAATA